MVLLGLGLGASVGVAICINFGAHVLYIESLKMLKLPCSEGIVHCGRQVVRGHLFPSTPSPITLDETCPPLLPLFLPSPSCQAK